MLHSYQITVYSQLPRCGLSVCNCKLLLMTKAANM